MEHTYVDKCFVEGLFVHYVSITHNHYHKFVFAVDLLPKCKNHMVQLAPIYYKIMELFDMHYKAEYQQK